MSLGSIAFGGVGVASSTLAPAAAAGPVSVASALATLRLRPGATVAISDSQANIQKSLDALQGVAARITGLAATDASPHLSVSAAQYRKDAAILDLWGATDGQTAEVTGISAANASAFATQRAAWVGSFTVADASANLAQNLDSLQALVHDGTVTQIVHTGAATPLQITAAQLAADADALAAIKNQAYALDVRDAGVDDALGLGGKTALTANARVKVIRIKDTTAAIEQNLDALQRVGLKLRSIAQTDAGSAMTVSAGQVTGDAIALGKILTTYHLDVIKAAAAQVAKLAANAKVQSVSVSDTAANIASRWSLLNRLADSLDAVEVTDGSNPVALTGDQVAQDNGVLAKFSYDQEHVYSLAVSGVKAGSAAAIGALDHVGSIAIADTADQVATHLADLEDLDGRGLLSGVSLTGKSHDLSLDASQVLGNAAKATQGVLDKIATLNYGLAVSGATVSQLDTLSANDRVSSIALCASSAQIQSGLATLAALGRRLAGVEQSDSGTAIALTQADFDAHTAVLARIGGGYTVSLSGASVAQALVDAANGHVTSVSVADTGRNLASHWRDLRTMGGVLAGVTRTDDGALAITATGYQLAKTDGLVAKFAADQTFALSKASVAQALQLAGDSAVDQIDVVDDGSAVSAQIAALVSAASGGKLHGIALNATSTRIALHAGQLDAAQDVLGLVAGGRYALDLDQVDIANLGDLLAGNDKIASVRVTADADGVATHLADLGSAGSKLVSITRTDSPDVALTLSGADFDAHRFELAKISGGYLADLSAVAAARAPGLAANAHIHSMQVSDSGASLSANWNALDAVGSKLAEVAQSDSAAIGISASLWARTHGLGAKFSTTLALSISGAGLGDLATLNADDAVTQIQASDYADAISDAWSDLAGNAKLTQLRLKDPATALTMSADTYAASTALLGLIPDGQYTVALSGAAVADAATLQADTQVASFGVSGSSDDIASSFDTLAGLDKLDTLTLSDANGTLSLTAAQVLGGGDTLARIDNGYRIAATGAALADLGTLQAVDNLASIAISDTAANVSSQLDDLVTMGSQLAGIHLSDATPVLALTQSDWSAATSTLAKIDGSYGVSLSEVTPGSVETVAADSSVQAIAAAGTADSIAQNWGALLAAYNDGAGKLGELSVTDDQPLALTEAQQADGAAMIAALLPGQTLVTA